MDDLGDSSSSIKLKKNSSKSILNAINSSVNLEIKQTSKFEATNKVSMKIIKISEYFFENLPKTLEIDL
jgi:hypothetical protein